jgi:hypothetical protein
MNELTKQSSVHSYEKEVITRNTNTKISIERLGFSTPVKELQIATCPSLPLRVFTASLPLSKPRETRRTVTLVPPAPPLSPDSQP